MINTKYKDINLPIPKDDKVYSIRLIIDGQVIGTVQIQKDSTPFIPEICVCANLFPIYYKNLRFDEVSVVCEEMVKTQLKDNNIWELEHVGVENGEIKVSEMK